MRAKGDEMTTSKGMLHRCESCDHDFARDPQPTPDTPLVRWLRERVRIAEREAKAYAAEGQYGEAGKAIGRAEGYAFTVLHIEFEAKCHER